MIGASLLGEAEFNAKIAIIANIAEGGKLKNALMEGGKIIETACKGLCPVDTGRLRASIITEEQDEKTVIVAPHTDYAMYVEFGLKNKNYPAQPYMKPGFESSRQAALDHIRAKLGEATVTL